jgi:hypothetical protein
MFHPLIEKGLMDDNLPGNIDEIQVENWPSPNHGERIPTSYVYDDMLWEKLRALWINEVLYICENGLCRLKDDNNVPNRDKVEPVHSDTDPVTMSASFELTSLPSPKSTDESNFETTDRSNYVDESNYDNESETTSFLKTLISLLSVCLFAIFTGLIMWFSKICRKFIKTKKDEDHYSIPETKDTSILKKIREVWSSKFPKRTIKNVIYKHGSITLPTRCEESILTKVRRAWSQRFKSRPTESLNPEPRPSIRHLTSNSSMNPGSSIEERLEKSSKPTDSVTLEMYAVSKKRPSVDVTIDIETNPKEIVKPKVKKKELPYLPRPNKPPPRMPPPAYHSTPIDCHTQTVTADIHNEAVCCGSGTSNLSEEEETNPVYNLDDIDAILKDKDYDYDDVEINDYVSNALSNVVDEMKQNNNNDNEKSTKERTPYEIRPRTSGRIRKPVVKLTL